MIWRRALHALGAALAALAVLTIAYFLAGWIGSAIPRNDPPSEPRDGIAIMVESNGTHTGIVMPVVSSAKDWRTVFPTAALARADGQIPTHIGVGWGEREVFLDVPTWSDLSPLTAARIAAVGGEPVIRVSHYVRPVPRDDYRPVTIDRENYARMAAAIEASLQPTPPDGVRAILRGNNPADAYYAARGHYTLGYTCNNWVGDMLALGGVRMGWWTPFAGGVMKWIAPPAQVPDS